jgi:uncharacterized membrane protein
MNYFPSDFNPPASYLISWLVVRIFGESEFWLRLPSVLLGVANVWLIYKLAQELLPNKPFSISFARRRIHFSVGHVASLLVATAPLHLYYSQEARPYLLATFAATWSMWELWKLVKGETRQWWRYGLATTLMLYSHYLTWLLLPAQGLLVALSQRKPILNHWVKTAMGIGVALIPWFPILLTQLKTGTGVAQSLPAWRQLGELSFKNLGLVPVKFLVGRVSLENEFVYGLIAGLLVLGIGALLSVTLLQKGREQELKRILWLWLIVPLALGALLSIKVPVFQYFRFLFTVPALYLLLVWGATCLRKQYQGVVIGSLLLVNLISSGIYLFNPQFHREDWRSAVAYLQKQDATPKVIILRPVAAPFWYYDRESSQMYDYSEIDQVRFEKRVWLITYAQPIFEPQNRTEQRLHQYGFEEVTARDFRGVGVKYLVNPAGLTAQGDRGGF